MKFTIDWLKDHLNTDLALEPILFALTDLGLEVESYEDPAEKLKHFVVGEIVNVEKHPNADRLKVCNVLTDKGEKQIICGAPNARPGIKVVVAHPGTYIPGTDVTIKVGKIREVESHGMMCSERELMLSDEHDGIIELKSDVVIGQKYINYCDNLDVTIEIAVTPNRPDALGVRGVARDLAAKGIGNLKKEKDKKIFGKFESPIDVKLGSDVHEKDCPLFIGRYIRNIRNTESPEWLRRRLLAIGLRPISALVDITNYLTFDRARPLHVFDARKLKGNLTIRKAFQGEKITALDGLEYQLNIDDTVIASGGTSVSIAGLIGGMDTGCDLDTTEVFLESAYFDPVSTAKSGRRLKINSDARFRFERGIDPEYTEPGIELATEMIMNICGGEASKLVIAGSIPEKHKEIILRPKRVESLIGIPIKKQDQIRILEALDFKLVEKIDHYLVTVPSWRPDVSVEADLIEEIVRVTSLSKLESVPLKRNIVGVNKPILTQRQQRISFVRRRVASSGLNECISYSFIDKKSAELFRTDGNLPFLINPISSEMSHLRPSLLPALCQAIKRNQSRSYTDLKLFEVGEIFYGNQPGQQKTHVSGILSGKHQAKDSFSVQRGVDLFDVKKIVEITLSEMGLEPDNLTLTRDGIPNYYHPGRSGAFSFGPTRKIAFFGEIHPNIQKIYDIKGPIVGFEVLLDDIPFPKKKKIVKPPLKLSEFQQVDRDFSFVVPFECEVNVIRRSILTSEEKYIKQATLFDVFEGPAAEAQLGTGMKSVAYTVRLQPWNATFTDEEIDIISRKIIENVEQVTGGVLRS